MEIESFDQFPEEDWPTHCKYCGQDVPENASRHISQPRIYNTESGKPEPGDLYYAHWMPLDWNWDNNEGPDLYAILPNGVTWNIDGRANNCTMKDDRQHRCWCRHGDPPNITVDKNGYT